MQARIYFPEKKYRKKMVKWFNLITLVKTGLNEFRSRMIGEQIDGREVASHNNRQSESSFTAIYQFSNEATDFYFDFIADIGDGWASTYTIASLLSRDQLCIQTEKKKYILPRGRFLLLGGDEVYPFASEKNYFERLVTPFKHAANWRWLKTSGSRRGEFLKNTEAAKVYVIPGNHDWFDGLSSFRRRFCNLVNPRKLGLWQTNQSFSYFAIKLPANWYILAIDFGLFHTLNNQQYNYFKTIFRKFKPGARIIIMAAEPAWVHGSVQSEETYILLQQFERDMLEEYKKEHKNARRKDLPRVLLNLSGDIHIYESYESLSTREIQIKLKKILKTANETDRNKIEEIVNEELEFHYKRHRIVSGGGGAFLHPTHGLCKGHMSVVPFEGAMNNNRYNAKAEVSVKDLFKLRISYPPRKVSRNLSHKSTLVFAFRNWVLSCFLGLLYCILSMPFYAELAKIMEADMVALLSNRFY